MPVRFAAASLVALLAVCGVAARPALGGEIPAERVAGRYRIEHWRSLEASGIRHRFELRADGTFELAGDWPDHERSRFTGRWTVSGNLASLTGEGEVKTNQGDWRTAFSRVFRISEEGGRVRLTPVPEKNRYGILGWPDSFVRED
jgi:hypothetical protein